MANNAFVEYVSKQTLEEGQKAITQLNQMIEKIGIIGVEAQKVRFPSESKKIISDVNKELSKQSDFSKKAQQNIEKQRLSEIKLQKSREAAFDKYQAQIEKEKSAREKQVKSESDLRQRLLAQRKREEAAASRKIAQIEKERKRASKLAEPYNRLRASLNKATLSYQNLAAKQGLSNSATIKAQKEVQRLRGKIDAINKPIKLMGDNVGNYPNKFGLATNAIKGLIGAFGLIEGVRLAFNFTKESIQLAKEAKGVEFAFVRLGEEGRRAFEDIKKATRGTLSDLDIKKSINEFNNLGISLETSGVAFEFLSVRAAQTGKTVESMKEDLVTGLGRGSVRILDNLGLSMSELNELTKEQGLTIQQAFGVIARREIEKAGNILDESVNSSEKLRSSFENLKVSIGQLSTDTKGIDFLGFFVGIVDDLTNGFKTLKIGIQGITQGFNDFIEPVKVLLNDFPLLQKFTSFLGDQFSKLYEVLSTTTLSRIGLAFKVLGATLSGLGNVVKTLKESFIDFFASFESFKNIDFSNPLKAVKQIGTAFSNVAKSSKEEAKDLVTAFREGFINAMKTVTSSSEGSQEKLISNSKKTNDKIKKDFKESIKDTFNLQKQRLQNEIKINEDIAKNNEESLEDRLAANQVVLDKTDDLNKLEKDFAISNAQGRVDEITRIEEEYLINKEDAIQKSEDNLDAIFEDNFKNQKDRIKELSEEQKAAQDRGVFDIRERGRIEGRSRKDIERDVQDFIQKEREKAINNEISRLSTLLDTLALNGEERKKIEKEIIDLKLQLLGIYDDADQAAEAKRLERIRKTERAVSDSVAAIGDIVSVSFDRRITKIDEEIEANEVATEAKLRNFRGTDEERQQIEEAAEQRRKQLEKKRREDMIKKAKFEKAIAIAQAVIGTAAAVIEQGVVTPAAILAGVLGAIQIAVIAAEPIPQYKHGKGANDNYEGAAIWGEDRQEVKYNPNTGALEVSPNKATLTNVLKDDMIFSSIGAFDDYSKNNLMLNDPIMTSRYAPSLITPDTVNTTIDVLMSDFNSRMEEKIEKGIKKGFKSVNLNVHNSNPVPDMAALLRQQKSIDV